MFLSRVMALPMAFLILLLSLSSVSHHLHELIFHGDEGCRHSFGHHSCGAHDKHEDQEEKGEEELPCPVLLLAKSFLAGDYQPDLTFSIALVFEPVFSFPLRLGSFVNTTHSVPGTLPSSRE